MGIFFFMTIASVIQRSIVLAMMAGSLLWLAAVQPVQAGLFDTNLLANPNAEAGPSGNGNLVTNIPGWQSNGDLTVVSYTTGGGYPVPTDPGPENRGAAFFAGYLTASSTGTQAIDLSSIAAAIDGGGVTCELTGYLGGFSTQGDNARLQITYLNAASNSLGTLTIGPVLPVERTNMTGLLLRQNNGAVPAGTRGVVALLSMTRTEGSFNDGYADNLSFVLRSASRPSLQITRLGNLVRLAWSTNFIGFQIETKTDLDSNVAWTNFPGASSISGPDFTVSTTISERQRYFRLRQ